MDMTKEVSEQSAFPDQGRRTTLEELRSLLYQAVPDAVETIHNGMTAFEYRGKRLCLFMPQKRHMSLYLSSEVIDKHREQLKGLSVGTNSVSFMKSDDIPKSTLALMLKEAAQSGIDQW